MDIEQNFENPRSTGASQNISKSRCNVNYTLINLLIISFALNPITNAEKIYINQGNDPQKEVMTYNCNNPSNVKKYTLEDDSKCRERSKTIDERIETQIDIFQENSLIEVEGYSCEIWRDRTVHQCGSFSHSSVFPEKWWNRKVFFVPPGECKIWIRTGQYRVSNFEVCPECQNVMETLTFPIKSFNGENQYDYYSAGYAYTDGDDLNCEGGKAFFDRKLLSQTLIHNHDTVVIKHRKVIVDKTQEKERYTVLDSKQE